MAERWLSDLLRFLPMPQVVRLAKVVRLPGICAALHCTQSKLKLPQLYHLNSARVARDLPAPLLSSVGLWPARFGKT